MVLKKNSSFLAIIFPLTVGLDRHTRTDQHSFSEDTKNSCPQTQFAKQKIRHSLTSKDFL